MAASREGLSVVWRTGFEFKMRITNWRVLKITWSSAGKKCNAFKQYESSAKIIFRKALGVILDAQQNRS